MGVGVSGWVGGRGGSLNEIGNANTKETCLSIRHFPSTRSFDLRKHEIRNGPSICHARKSSIDNKKKKQIMGLEKFGRILEGPSVL